MALFHVTNVWVLTGEIWYGTDNLAGFSDPYCKFKLGRQKRRSKVQACGQLLSLTLSLSPPSSLRVAGGESVSGPRLEGAVWHEDVQGRADHSPHWGLGLEPHAAWRFHRRVSCHTHTQHSLVSLPFMTQSLSLSVCLLSQGPVWSWILWVKSRHMIWHFLSLQIFLTMTMVVTLV